MCGIAGIVDLDGGSISADLLIEMNQELAHRGPDDAGYVLIDERKRRWANFAGSASPQEIRERMPILQADGNQIGANIGLAHCRFSIIDLSPSGHQPFFDDAGDACLVFNGEIYNYLEVRERLTAKGVRFVTESDTEVLMKAYLHWGPSGFAKLNGFWAVAIYDLRNRKLILTRDRLGKRPLYYARRGSRVYFASEIKALLKVPEIGRNRAVNREAIDRWLTYGVKDLNFSTCFEGIHTLPSASWVAVDKSFPGQVQRFWSMPAERMTEKDITAGEAARVLRDTLEDAVRIRLRADVPLSVELSGGLDSSALVALAAAVNPGKITTYTVRFPDPRHNEEPYARSVAQRFRTDYRVLDSPTANFWRQIRAFTYLEEEPYHSPNLETNQAIWARMRSLGTKVSLNGAGGDENFAGYSVYYGPAQVENLIAGRFGTYLTNALKYSQGRTNIKGIVYPLAAAGLELCRRFLPNSRPGNSAPRYLRSRSVPPVVPRPLTLTQALHSDMTDTLMPYWLRSGDRGYMGIPLEVRAPLLDYRVVELAFGLPVTYLFRDGWHKWILRKALQDILPADVVWRKRKMGFPFPFETFYSENRAILDLILDNCSNPFVDLSHKDDLRHNLKAISFLLWYELFFSNNTSLFDRIEQKAREISPAQDHGFTPLFLSAAGCRT